MAKAKRHNPTDRPGVYAHGDIVDMNQCEFDCVLVEEPQIELRPVRGRVEPVPYAHYVVACNSQMNSKHGIYFHCIAWGAQAQFASDMLHKGYRIHIHGKLLGMIHRPDTESKFSVTAMFDVKRTLILRVPTPKEPIDDPNYDPDNYVSTISELTESPEDED
jgi:hypothetical protein